MCPRRRILKGKEKRLELLTVTTCCELFLFILFYRYKRFKKKKEDPRVVHRLVRNI